MAKIIRLENCYHGQRNRFHGERRRIKDFLNRKMKQFLPKRKKISWPDNIYYFLTSSTCLHYPYFKEIAQKQLVLNKIIEASKILNIPVQAFSISLNHFHLKFYLDDGRKMAKLKNILHSGISREYRKIYQVPYKTFWQSSKVFYIKNEEISWKITGYIIGNLLKHREVSTFAELKENPFSSYRFTIKKFCEETTMEIVRSVINIEESNEGVVDMKELEGLKVGSSL